MLKSTNNLLSVFLFIWFLFFISFFSFAQEAIDYEFTVAQDASLIDMNSGTTELIGANKTATSSNVIPLGFEVWFMGERYTDFSVNCNGTLRFGTTKIHPNGNTYDIPDNARIAVFAGLDSDPVTNDYIAQWKTSANGKVHYKIIGTAPQRQLVVEWKNLHINYESPFEDATFQLVVHETASQPSQPQGGRIEMIYGKMNLFLDLRNVRCGIGGKNGGNETMGIDLTQNPPTNKVGDVSNVLDSGVIPSLNRLQDGNRVKFTFQSPIPNVEAENLRTICDNQNGIQLDWDLTDGSGGNTVGSVLYKSTDGTNYSFIYQTEKIQDVSYFDADVDLQNTYWYQVYTVTEGQLSTLQSSGELRVAPNEVPEFDLGKSILCEGDSVVLDAGNFASYEWKNGANQVLGTSQTLSVKMAGNYAVTVFDTEGCEQLGRSEVIFSRPPVFSLESEYTFCENESITIEAPDGQDFARYEWVRKSGQKVEEGQDWETREIGDFYLKITNEDGCFSTDTFTIKALLVPSIEIVGEPYLCEKTPLTTLTAQVDDTGNDPLVYEWYKGSTFLSDTSELEIDEVGIYTITVKNTVGCETSKSIEVINCCEPVLTIPNAFTPFSTPDNNEYGIEHQDLKSFHMRIYNRWGILVFETTDPEIRWDGTFNGKPLQPSVYQMVIEYTGCRNGVTFQEKLTEAIYLLD